MTKKVGFGGLEREMLSIDRLPTDVRLALVQFKNQIKIGQNLSLFRNQEGGLPAASVGQVYYEHQVGNAHDGDPEPRGKHRLVALVDGGRNILKMYFTGDHYAKQKWQQLQFP